MAYLETPFLVYIKDLIYFKNRIAHFKKVIKYQKHTLKPTVQNTKARGKVLVLLNKKLVQRVRRVA